MKHDAYRILVSALVWLAVVTSAQAGEKVSVITLPDGGKQPHAIMDSKGIVHAVYFKGENDIYYANYATDKATWSTPMRVNSQAGSAIVIGTIRGAQLAIGKAGRVHVVWNGSKAARPQGSQKSTPFLYSRMNDDGTAFEKQRSLLKRTHGLDGGGAIAADDKGNVYAFWHGLKDSQGEANRSAWVRLSTDGGKSFGKEKRASKKGSGACACCGMRAFMDSKGKVYAVFRAATKRIDRDITLLRASAGSTRFKSKIVHKWKLQACPMSTSAFASGADKTVLAWETNKQVYFASTDKLKKAIPAPGTGNRKHPAVAVNNAGETILVWAEGTGWNRGGDLYWQVFDAKNKPTAIKGSKAGGIPVWGLAAVVTKPDGTFLVIH